MKKVITHLSFQVLVAIVLGLLFGLYFPNYASSAKLLSQTFINMITMLIAPIIFFTIVLGISSMDNMHKVGRVGGKALLYFEVITTFAIVIGLVVANIFKPGVGVDMAITDVAKVKEYQAGASQIEWGSFIAHIVPHNIVESFAKGDILQILFFAILFGFGLSKIGSAGTSLVSTFEKINKVLFDIYNPDKEQYYIERKIDELIINCLKFQSIWVYGKSGRGKSISVFRNILQSNYNCISVSLANCIGFGIDEFFNEIYIELNSYLEPESKTSAIPNHQDAVRQINLLLEKHYPSQTIFILIDESPLVIDEHFKIFTERIFSLFISSALVNKNVDIKYVLSSIYSPVEHIKDFQQKIGSLIRFVEFENWENEELYSLISMISKELNLSLKEDEIQKIIKDSKGSPRWLKKFFKNTCILGEFSTSNIENAIIQTNKEIPA